VSTETQVADPASDSPPQPSPAQWQQAVAAIRGTPLAATVLLVCHVNPDGDALGSMLGFALGLRRLGYSGVQASFPGTLELPDPLRVMAGLDLLVDACAVAPDPELVISFDAASIERLGELGDVLVRAPTSVLLDHHASSTRFGQINLVDPSAAATAVLVDGLLQRLGVPLDVEIAECLYVALATDTGSFKFDASTPAVHEFAARLIATGLPVGELSQRLFDTRPYGAVRLFADALCRTELEPAAAGGLGLVWTYATLADLERHGQRPQVLEALIDSVRCVEEADVACVIKQMRPSEWAVSMRSKGGVDVSEVAVALGGGGHRYAAGFTGRGAIGEVIAALRARLGELVAGES
jgi:bifunctional oligoribonuclease and PAP phosphatase NrnA